MKRVMDYNPVDWIGTSRRLGEGPPTNQFTSVNCIFRQELQNSNQEESSRLDGDPYNWINCSESSRNSRLQFLKNLVNWMVIQATGLINPNQAKSPGGILMKI